MRFMSLLSGLLLSSLGALVLASAARAQTLLLEYNFNETSGSYASAGSLTPVLTPRGSNQTFGANGSGVSGAADDRAWDASGNVTQGATTPANNAAITTPATGLNLASLSGFTISFWFKTEQSLNSDAALRFVYKADRATSPVSQGLTLRSYNGALELRIGGKVNGQASEIVVVSTKFGTSSGYNKVNDWVFVAITWDGSAVQYYVGGKDYPVVPAGGGAFGGTIVNNTGDLVLANTSSFNRGLDGWMDNFRFYDGALSKAALEALRLADIGAPPPVGTPVRALADTYTVIGQTLEPQSTSLYAPSLLRTSSGRLIASYERNAPGRRAGLGTTMVSTSDNGGVDWTQRAALPLAHARVFSAGNNLYLLGLDGDLAISRSTDGGGTWSSPQRLSTGRAWFPTTANVLHAKGSVYLAMTARTTRGVDDWPVEDASPILLRASESADLTQRASWTLASELSFRDVLTGATAAAANVPFFGLPVRRTSAARPAPAFERRAMNPMGWLEANVAQLIDPDNYWYDATGNTFHLLMRAHTGGSNVAALLKVVEQADGSMTTTAETVPSGKRMVLLPVPGGQDAFALLYDPVSSLYWLASVQPTDSLRRSDKLPAEWEGRPVGESQRLVLHFSRNLVDWCFAGLITTGANATEKRHFPALEIDGEDLVVAAVSSDQACARGSEGNLVTFHRVASFRDLIY